MMRHWSSQKETGYFHRPKNENDMATFIPDNKAMAVSFDGFGTDLYPVPSAPQLSLQTTI